MIRSREKLRRDQQAILMSYREESAGSHGKAASRGTPSSVAGIAVYGRVSAVVSADSIHGPHVLVVRQVWRGMPKVVGDSDSGPIRCHPAPGRGVGDYVVGDYVRVTSVGGATVAERLA